MEICSIDSLHKETELHFTIFLVNSNSEGFEKGGSKLEGTYLYVRFIDF